MPANTSSFRTFLRLLALARGFWPHLTGIFLLDQLTWLLVLATPLPLKIVLDTLAGQQALPAWLARLLPPLTTTQNLLLAVGLQILIAAANMARDATSHLLCTYTGERLTLDFRQRLFAHAQRLSLAFHDLRGTADSIYRIQYDTQSIQWIVIYGVGPFCANLILLVAMIAVTAAINWKLALVALAVTPLLVIIPRLFKGVGAERYRAVKEQEADALEVIQEVLTALRVVKAFGREEDEQARFVQRSRQTLRAKVRLAAAEAGLSIAIKLTTAAGAALVLLIGAWDVLAGKMTIGLLTMVIYYTAQLYSPLEQITKKIADILWSLVSVQRAFELLDQSPEVPQKPHPIVLKRARGHIQFEHVSFAYGPPPDAPWVLRDVCFQVEPGQCIGLVGRTGAGKTTLVSLLMRFYDPIEGRILLDGLDLRDLSIESLRNQFSIVLQEPVLFASSIAENIAYSRPGATMAQIEAAARAAGAHDFIMRLPEGYATQVGERGMRLSGGERQRISLARAFLKDAPILILDEPTSSVDLETERQIMDAMQRLLEGRTTFIIAHRLATLARCHRILRVEDGRVVEIDPSQVLEADVLAGTRP